ncbi:hypothetical protein [Nocardia harenae]|uniref:hypothetical protein n=1 Tax=Nocardia harenae TaxID=358707 RepID=UPI000835EBB8|nr:hypothetical protein [Nocardia harenae]
MDRHIRIEYAVGVIFDFRVSATADGQLTSTLHGWAPDARITVDDHVTDELPVIPCAALWEP